MGLARRVIGIDPGTAVCGFGVVERGPGGIQFCAAGTIRTGRIQGAPARLKLIYERLLEQLQGHMHEINRDFRQQADLEPETRRLRRDITHHDLVSHPRRQRLIGLGPGSGRKLMADRQFRHGGICVPLRMHVLFNVAVNGQVHHPLMRQGFTEARQATAVAQRLRTSTYPPGQHQTERQS